jgi:hypothetical protein
MGNFFLVPVNYFGVLLCGIASMVIGFVWYGPLFGRPWSKMVGMTKEKMEAAKSSMPMTYGGMLVASLVMAYVLEHFIWYAAPGSLTLFIAVKTSVWAWLGFIATYAFSRFLFSVEKKPWTLLAIESGYYLVTLVVMAVILYFV